MSVNERHPGSRPSGGNIHGSQPHRSAHPQGRPSSEHRAQRSAPQRRAPQQRPVRRPNGPKKKSGAGKIVLIIVELLVLAGLGVALYFVLTATKSGKMDLPVEDIIINEEVKEKLKSSSGASGSSTTGTRSLPDSSTQTIFL